MSVPERDEVWAAASVHIDTADSDMSALRISQATADEVRSVRKSINEAAGTRMVTNEDVVRLALLSLGLLDEVAEKGPEALSEDSADVISPLMAHIHEATDPDVLRRHMDNPADDGGDSQ